MTALLLRVRRLLFPALAALIGWFTALEPPDLYRFGQFGVQLLSGHLDRVYADSWNQAGPLQLVLARLLLIGSPDRALAPATIALIDAAVVLAAMRLCRDRRTELIVGASALLWFALPQPWNGHPIEMLIALGWLGAVALHRRGSWPAAAIVLALTVAIAPWAILATPVVLAVPGFWRAVRTGTLAVLLAIGCYLPFAFTGHFHLFDHQWMVNPFSAVHLIAPGLNNAGWSVRLVQAIITSGGCAAFAWWQRGKPAGFYLAPFVAGVLRVATDPVIFAYYWTSVAVIGVIAVARLDWRRPVSLWIAVAGLCYLPWALAASGRGGPLLGGLCCLLVVGVLLGVEGRHRRAAPVTPIEPRMRDDGRHAVPANA
ncbi:MAG TPA: hypothetical protein VHO01_00340 [Jatrophihabitans sp.]|nr:hypothetical protein [Jatrophihabitans sp.]